MANLYDKAGLVNIPVGYQDGFLYNIKPEDNTLGFRFNRDSAATLVNSKGLIEQVGYFGPELVQNGNFSELGPELVTNGDFATDSNWTKGGGATISNGRGNIIGDGTSFTNLSQPNVFTVGKFYKVTLDAVINSGLGLKVQDGSTNENFGAITTSGTYTFYGKANNSNLTIGRRTGGTAFDSYIDNVSVKQVGQGWSFVGDGSVGNGELILPCCVSNNRVSQSIGMSSSKSYKLEINITEITSGDTIDFLQGGSWTAFGTQLGINTAYITNPSDADLFLRNNNGTGRIKLDNISVIEVIGDKPRIDYTDSLTSPSFLLEPQSTNLYTDSNNFLSWSVVGSLTLTPNYTISPSGENNATRLQWGSGTNFLYKTLSHVGNNFTNSFYIKSNTSVNQYLKLFLDNGAQTQEETITPQWQRFTFTNYVTPTQTNRNVGLISSTNQVGDLDVSIAFSQFEALSYPTSYIPTAGSTVTRAQETCNNAGSASTFNSTEGVLYAEIAALANDGINKYISINNGGTTDYIFFRYRSDNDFQVKLRSGNTDKVNQTFTLSNNLDFIKIAFSYKENEFKIFVNGLQIGSTITTGATSAPGTLNNIDFERYDGASDFYGKTKGVYVFNEALTDDELQQLTGPEYNSFAALAAAYNYTVI